MPKSDSTGGIGRLDLNIQDLDDLQLSSRGLDGLLTICLLPIRLLARLPVQSAKSFGQDGMREMIAGVHPVSIHGAQILYLQSQQRSSKLLRIAKFGGKLVCLVSGQQAHGIANEALEGLTGLKLMHPAQNVQQQLDDSIQGRKSV